MTVNELLRRARSQKGKGIKYRLGGGKLKPLGDTCADERNSCDCSGFVDWCLTIDRQVDHPFYVRFNAGWVNTDSIWKDAKSSVGFFTECAPKAGAIIVYPGNRTSRQRGPKIGHVGIVTQVKTGKVTAVIHCSTGNMKIDGQAIHETPPRVFEKVQSTICCWYAGLS